MNQGGEAGRSLLAEVETDGSGVPFLPVWHGLGGSGLACGRDQELGLVGMRGFHRLSLALLLRLPKAEPT